MRYRIEQDASTREHFACHTYRIYEGDRLIARYWHDHKGDEHGIDFVDGTREGRPVGRMIEFLDGGGPDSPLTLTDRAVAYLDKRRGSGA